MNGGLRSCALLCLLACGQEATAPVPAPEFSAVLEQGLEESFPDSLLEVEEAVFDEVVELLELATLNARNGETAWRQLESMPPEVRTGALLLCVESREFAPELRIWAYSALRDFGTSAMLPRLTLRLKYEKDWGANVPLAEALLRHGSGAGLAAIETILSTEDAATEVRSLAAAMLQQLPPHEGWSPGASFDSDWSRLLEVRGYWLRHRELPDRDPAEFDAELRAACWRMLSRFRSQPLRPVDDARRVFERLPSEGMDFLIALAEDEDRYVREHALQTLAWIGAPVGERVARTGCDLPAALANAVLAPETRARALEALGASQAEGAADVVVGYLDDANYDVVTAAADAILRCGDASHRAQAEARLNAGQRLSPEGRYALRCFLLLESEASPEPVTELAMPEKARRDNWLAQRRAHAAAEPRTFEDSR